MTKLARRRYVPVSSGDPKLEGEELKALQLEVPMWQMVSEAGVQRLVRMFELDSFSDALAFTSRIGGLVESPGQLPTIVIRQNTLILTLWTPAVEGLHLNDFITAARIDQLHDLWVSQNQENDPVVEASEESFPASDSPGWIGMDESK